MSGGGKTRIRSATGATVALLAILTLGLAGAPPATATMPPTRCGKMDVGGKTYKVSTHLLECDFARKWARRYLKNGDHPRGWTCTSYPPEETRIAFSCRKRNTSYYAVRK
jgi:hypothetical protein